MLETAEEEKALLLGNEAEEEHGETRGTVNGLLAEKRGREDVWEVREVRKAGSCCVKVKAEDDDDNDNGTAVRAEPNEKDRISVVAIAIPAAATVPEGRRRVTGPGGVDVGLGRDWREAKWAAGCAAAVKGQKADG